MKTLTIAQLRKKEVDKLAVITGDYETARNLMNRFYRYAGMLDRLLYLENDERTANRPFTKELEDKAEKARERLNADFNKIGLMLEFYGYIPTITDHKGGNSVIYTYFYG